MATKKTPKTPRKPLSPDKKAEQKANLAKGSRMRGTHKAPENNMEIAILARKRVRGMFQVLNSIAKDTEAPTGPRVSAAKAIIDYAKLKPADVADLNRSELEALAKQIAASRAETDDEARDLVRQMEQAADEAGKLPN